MKKLIIMKKNTILELDRAGKNFSDIELNIKKVKREYKNRVGEKYLDNIKVILRSNKTQHYRNCFTLGLNNSGARDLFRTKKRITK